MQNIPWHEEVVHFVQKLMDLLPEYEIACEHEHSNCVLTANTKVGRCLLKIFIFCVCKGSKFLFADFRKLHETWGVFKIYPSGIVCEILHSQIMKLLCKKQKSSDVLMLL